MTGLHARVVFEPIAEGAQRQFVRVEEGTYANNAWYFVRLWNGDQSHYGLHFTSVP